MPSDAGLLLLQMAFFMSRYEISPLFGKKKGTATVKVTVKNLKGKKQTLKVRVKVGTGSSGGTTKKKGLYTKNGDKYITKWDWGAGDKFYIEDQHISARLVSKELDTNNGMWHSNPDKNSLICYNVFTFEITNHRSKPITLLNRMAVLMACNVSDYYENVIFPVYEKHEPDIYNGFLAFKKGNTVVQPGQTVTVTYSQPEARGYWEDATFPGPQEDDTLQILYRDEKEKKVLWYSAYFNDTAFTLYKFFGA